MSAEHTRTELRFTKDERLLAGVRGAIEHIERAHGVPEGECVNLAVAAEQACREALAHADKSDSLCAVTVDNFEDHVEVSVENSGQPEHAQSNSAAENLATTQLDERETEIELRLDRADFNTSNGHLRTKLVKYFHKNPAHS